MESDSKVFWMVYVDGRGAPIKKHFEYSEAENEAERLARLNDNRDRCVYILQSTQYCVVEEVPVTWHKI